MPWLITSLLTDGRCRVHRSGVLVLVVVSLRHATVHRDVRTSIPETALALQVPDLEAARQPGATTDRLTRGTGGSEASVLMDMLMILMISGNSGSRQF